MQTIAILGASSDRAKFGNKAVRAFHERGYHVYPVNPKGGIIEGLPVFRTLAEVPAKKLDMISIYLPPSAGLLALDEIARKHAKEIWINPGAESEALLAKAKALGLEVIAACSLVGKGIQPHQY